jgi:hypothetical protein
MKSITAVATALATDNSCGLSAAQPGLHALPDRKLPERVLDCSVDAGSPHRRALELGAIFKLCTGHRLFRRTHSGLSLQSHQELSRVLPGRVRPKDQVDIHRLPLVVDHFGKPQLEVRKEDLRVVRREVLLPGSEFEEAVEREVVRDTDGYDIGLVNNLAKLAPVELAAGLGIAVVDLRTGCM